MFAAVTARFASESRTHALWAKWASYCESCTRAGFPTESLPRPISQCRVIRARSANRFWCGAWAVPRDGSQARIAISVGERSDGRAGLPGAAIAPLLDLDGRDYLIGDGSATWVRGVDSVAMRVSSRHTIG